MNDTVSQKRSDQIMNSHKGVINSRPVKSMPREVSCEAPITREKSETHEL